MTNPTDPPLNRYSMPMRLLHWLVLAAVVMAVAAIQVRELFPRDSSERSLAFIAHESAGLLVLLLMTVRIFVRLASTVPPPVPGNPLIARAAQAMHLALYLLMLAMPVLGLLTVATAGYPLNFFGIPLDLGLAANKGLSGTLKDIHENGATLVYVLVGGHAAAALWHQFWVRDRLIARML
ncbi:cytochrome b [Ramlibacter sp. H39-3-26]|uniref:cytochrome b n=1 Tax=Curvibacter soli TaxID=3031331 RepID=UPI0023DC1A9F|nr:cytochrome b [Ramlibacter sp. H39-3-26]MDF1484730.1 cytochrome b [Ramlibacter sp. H39-3-26]